MATSYKEISNKRHKFYQGKIAVSLKVPVLSYEDFAIWYTPGVAEPCREIYADKSKVFDYTNRSNFVAIVTDGSRVLGLGNIGPEAGLPVMEGKALLFKYLGDVDAFPICLSTQDPDEIITAVKWLEPTFGGINLEDINSPKCFYIYDRLSRQMNIPVFHDDQQGTAVVALGGLISALKIVGKKLKEINTAIIGAGAAGASIAKLLMEAGANPKKMFMVDSKGILNPERGDMDEWKSDLAKRTNGEGRTGGILEAMKDADVTISVSRPGPGIITKEMVQAMSEDAIVFAMANPVPEILPSEAKEGGAKIVATGRSDYPNQVNNSIGFPAIFRGMLDVKAKAINVSMMLSAAYELARCAEEKGLWEDYIMPTMTEFEVFPREAAAVAKAAMETGVARVKMSPEEVRQKARERIGKYQKSLELLLKEGFMQPPPT